MLIKNKDKRIVKVLLITLVIAIGTGSLQAQDNPTLTQFLSGTGPHNAVEWDFYCTDGMNSQQWTTIEVPSCWEQQGFGTYNYGVYFYGKARDPGIPTEQGLYRYEFEVPDAWKGRNNILIFEASMTDTEVKLNGELAGPVHQGGFYRFSYDVSDLLEYEGTNLLEVTVSKESADSSVNLAERRADYWNFGGIFRPVFIESRPGNHIKRVAIDGQADGTFRAEVYPGLSGKGKYRIESVLTELSGEQVGQPVSLPVKRNASKVHINHTYSDIMAWTAETPKLYNAVISMFKGEELLHRTETRIGFRTIEIKESDGVYINGQRVILKGVNKHSFRPESGRTLSPDQNLEDVMLMKEMNMNTVRMSHYPPDPVFLDYCDEYGLYVLNELGGWHGKYDTEVGKKLVEELVIRDVNHPSVIFWDNGNEGGWNTELDDEFGKWDLQDRPVLHPQQDLSGLETMHYRSYGETQEYLRGKDIFFPTEILHGLYDGGHGAGLYDYWEMMRVHPRCAGGLLWVLADEGIMRTDLNGKIDCDGNHGADGIVGPHHEREGSFNTIREIWSPVQVTISEIPADFDGVLPLENRYDFINLKQCTFKWVLGEFNTPYDTREGHRILSSGTAHPPDIPPHTSGALKIHLPQQWASADVLYLSIEDPYGDEVWTWSSRIGKPDGNPLHEESDLQSISIAGSGDEAIIRVGDTELFFSRSNGLLMKVVQAGRNIAFGNGPSFIACRRGDRNLDGSVDSNVERGVDRVYYEVEDNPELCAFKIEENSDSICVIIDYFGALEQVSWTIRNDGEIRMDYRYRYDGAVELMGIQFEYPESEMKSLRWLGEGPYRVWQNRLHGTVLDVWENEYNDPVPGESFQYPEFKGFFGPFEWSDFSTEEGNILIATDEPDKFVGVYKPRDGRDSLLYTFPELGLGILDVIPAVRNKVNATDLVGPSSRVKHVSGPVRGSLYLRFE